jgi:hypothetical protein
MCLQNKTQRPRFWRRGLTKRTQGESGQELLEFAIIVPALVMLLLGIFWFGRAYNTRQTVTRAAREGARFAVAPTCLSCGNQLPNDTEIRATIDAALVASHIDPNQVANFSIQRGVVLNPGVTLTTVGTVIEFDYPFTFQIPFASMGLTTITLPIRVQMREE